MNKKKLEINAGIIGRRIEKLSVDELHPYPANPYTHPQLQLNLISWSLERFGFVNPVLVDHDNMVIAGHARIMAAKQINLSIVPALRLDLDEPAKRAFGLFDNCLSELASWDKHLLALEWQDLSDFVGLPATIPKDDRQ